MCQWNSNKAYENQNQTQILSAPNATTAEYYNTVVYHIQYMHIYVNIPIYIELLLLQPQQVATVFDFRRRRYGVSR